MSTHNSNMYNRKGIHKFVRYASGVKKCSKCRHSYYDTSNKGNWYCEIHKTHKEGTDYCGYFEEE